VRAPRPATPLRGCAMPPAAGCAQPRRPRRAQRAARRGRRARASPRPPRRRAPRPRRPRWRTRSGRPRAAAGRWRRGCGSSGWRRVRPGDVCRVRAQTKLAHQPRAAARPPHARGNSP